MRRRKAHQRLVTNDATREARKSQDWDQQAVHVPDTHDHTAEGEASSRSFKGAAATAYLLPKPLVGWQPSWLRLESGVSHHFELLCDGGKVRFWVVPNSQRGELTNVFQLD